MGSQRGGEEEEEEEELVVVEEEEEEELVVEEERRKGGGGGHAAEAVGGRGAGVVWGRAALETCAVSLSLRHVTHWHAHYHANSGTQ